MPSPRRYAFQGSDLIRTDPRPHFSVNHGHSSGRRPKSAIHIYLPAPVCNLPARESFNPYSILPNMSRSFETSSQEEKSSFKDDQSIPQKENDVQNLPELESRSMAAKPDGPIITSKSKGVIGMELLASRLNTKYFVLLYGGFVLLAYTLSLGEFLPPRYSGLLADSALPKTNTHPEHTTPMRRPRPLKPILCWRRSVSFEPSSNPSLNPRWQRSPTSLVVSTPTSSVSACTCSDMSFKLRLPTFT